MNLAKSVLVYVWHKLLLIKRRLIWMRNDIKVKRGSHVDVGVCIGRGTRINAASHIALCKIGKYCSIGGRLIVRSSNHDMRYPNMQDYLQKKVLKSSVKVAGKKIRDVYIGDACWIGDSVIVLPGVHLGEGCVVGAGSIVTKSVPPFSVVVGSPARVVRYRFNQEAIDFLLRLRWWDWSKEEILRNAWFFDIDLTSCDIDSVKSKLANKGDV